MGEWTIRRINSEAACLPSQPANKGNAVHVCDLSIAVTGLDLKLTAQVADRASRIESSDGQVKIRVPHDLTADLDVTTGDGRIDCSLP